METSVSEDKKENANQQAEIVPLNQEQNPSLENRPIAGNTLDDAPIGLKSANNPFGNIEDNGKDLDNTLEGRLKSSDPKIRAEAYTELISWSDPDYTATIFAKGLHLIVKEKDSNVIDKLLTAIESLMDTQPNEYAMIDVKKFLANFTEFLLNNVKGPAKEHANLFIIKWWEKGANKTDLLERIKEMIVTVKMKLQEKALYIVLELLKAGKIEEMQLLKPLYPELEKQIVSRTAAIKTITFEIYKEVYLWIGEGLKTFASGLKEAQSKELDAWIKTVDPTSMKTLKKEDGTGKAKKFDIYESVAEAELPKKYNEDQFADDVMAQVKWNERKKLIDDLNALLEKTPKISQKTNAFIYLNLAKRIFMESNIAVQVSIIKTLGYLASGMRKGFFTVAKTMFSVLLGKLKEKNRQLSEEILSSLEKFYFVLTFEETYEEIEENLKDKNPEKKLNILNLLGILHDKLDKIKTVQNSIKVVKIVVKLIDENDSVIREKASELIAKQLDLFEEKINPLLKDLPSQKMSKIMKHRQKMSNIPLEDPATAKAPTAETVNQLKLNPNETDKDKIRNRNQVYDKSQMIAKIREEVFSNKKVKLSDVRNFPAYLSSNLTLLIDMTKEFKEINTAQASEIFLFIDEITQKVEKAVFQEDSRRIIAQFYIEQLLGKTSDELTQSIDRYINCSSKIMFPRNFLQDILNVLNKKTGVKISKELLSFILNLYEEEVQNTNKLSAIPHNLFVEFLKIYFSVANIHVSIKLPLIQTMRIVSTKFGEKATNDFPAVLFKELSSQNTDLQKVFEKTYEKLMSPDPDKNKQAINDLNSCEDHSKINYFWSKPEFLSFLKTQLNSDGRFYQFGPICQIVSNYLLTKAESPIDFKIKNYLTIFQTILSIHYSPDNEMKRGETEKILTQTVESLGAAAILNDMISDTVLSQSKVQILNFFFQYSYAIEPNLKIINYLNNIIDVRGPSQEIQPLLDLVLLIIKNTHNDEVIIRGSENRYIRDVWQKHEIDLLLNENFVRGTKVFEDQTTFNMIKNFLMSSLKLEELDFHSYDLEKVAFGVENPALKLKLAFYYIRSVENIKKNGIFILNQIFGIKMMQLTEEEILIALKTVFNVLKNFVYMQNQDIFRKGRDFFIEYVQKIMQIDEFAEIVDFNTSDHTYFVRLINKQETKLVHEMIERENRNEIGETSFMTQGPYGNRQNDGFHPNTVPKNKPNQLKVEDIYPGTHQKFGDSPTGIKSIKKKPISSPNNNVRQPKSQNEIQNRQTEIRDKRNFAEDFQTSMMNDVSYVMTGATLERPEILQNQFEKLQTFDIEKFEEGSQYFQDLCKSTSPTSQQFLCSFANEIITVFVSVCSAIFEEGINYDLERSSYELIFLPFQMLFNVEEFLMHLQPKTLNYLVNQILFRLVTSNEEKIINISEKEANKEELSKFVISFWNSLMLRAIERADQNLLITALFTSVMELNIPSDDPVETGVFNLSMKCLAKISKNFKVIIQMINPAMIFSLVHQYIQLFGVSNSDSIGSKTIKSIISELVMNSDFQEIWIFYDQTFGDQEETNICRWIKIVQNKIVDTKMTEMIRQSEAQGTAQSAASLIEFYFQIRELLPDLRIENYSEHFQDQGFFEHIMSEIESPPIDPKSFSKSKQSQGNGRQNNERGLTPKPREDISNAQIKNIKQTNQKKSVDKFKKTTNIDQFLDKSEISNYSEVNNNYSRNTNRIKNKR